MVSSEGYHPEAQAQAKVLYNFVFNGGRKGGCRDVAMIPERTCMQRWMEFWAYVGGTDRVSNATGTAVGARHARDTCDDDAHRPGEEDQYRVNDRADGAKQVTAGGCI